MKAQELPDQLRENQKIFNDLLNANLFRGVPAPPGLDEDSILANYFPDLSEEEKAALRRRTSEGWTDLFTGKSSDLDWSQRAHHELLRNLGDDAREELTGQYDIAVGLLLAADFNGSALQVPGDEKAWIVTLNLGLQTVVYSFARALLSTTTTEPDDGGEATAPTYSEAEAATALYDVLRHYAYFGIAAQHPRPTSRYHGILAWRITDAAEKFVYCHEIGHILLRHPATSPRRALPDVFGDTPLLAPSPDQEFEADVIAWELLTKVLLFNREGIEPFDLQVTYAGARLFLRIAESLERTGIIVQAETHPPATKRLDLLRYAAQELGSKLGAPSGAIEVLDTTLAYAWERVEQRLPPTPWPSPLDELLQTVSASRAGNFASLTAANTHQEARRGLVRLLALGVAPHKLCRELGRSLGRAERTLKQLGIDVGAVSNEAESAPSSWWTRFRDVSRAHLTRKRSRSGEQGKFASLSEKDKQAARAASSTFMLIEGIKTAYLPAEISNRINRHRDAYLKETGDAN